MSRKLIRHTVSQWLEAAQIPNLGAVFPGKPRLETFTNMLQAAGPAPFRSLMYVLAAREKEIRIATGGPYTGEKQIDYEITLRLEFHAAPNGTDDWWQDAHDAYDDICESVKEQIRTGGRTLGRPDVILQAGEWTTGIEGVHEEPSAWDGGTMLAIGEITFEVTEVIIS